MKRAVSLLLVLTLALGLVTLPAAAVGESYTFRPAELPADARSVDTGIPGMTLTLGADEWSCAALDIPMTSATGVDYHSFLTGKANPKFAEGTGTYYSFTFDDTVKTGSLEIMYRLNANKGFFILDNGEAMPDYNGMKLDVAADTSTTIIVEGGHTYTVYASGSKMRLYGCAFQNVEPQEVFSQEIAAFPFDRIKGSNADTGHVEENLVLVDSYESQFGSCDVSWTSSAPNIIDVDGTVNCQKTETQVTLTGHFSVQERREFAADVSFALTVVADPDDASAVAVATEALTLGDLSGVKRNLELPTGGKRGTTVTWQSSDERVVGADGKVYPADRLDQSATLTATISRGDATATKDFPVTVAGIVPVTLDAWTYHDAQGNTRFTPVDGGSVATVNVTCNDPNPARDAALFIAVYAADGAEKSRKEFSMAAFANVPTGKSVCLAVDLPMDSGDGMALLFGGDVIKADDTLSGSPTLYVVGDSTASVYGDDRYPRKGWAQMLEGYFDGVTVTDLALSGRASQSFKAEANYTTLKTSLKKGDYLIIQFGHNDNKADAYTDPAGDRFTAGSFQTSMLEYVELAWEKGAHPIIATSISRRKLSDESLEAYVKAAQDLAHELSVPCVDLYTATNAWVNQVGVEGAMDMFNCVKPHDSRFLSYPAFAQSEFYEKGSSDDTHLNIYGADLIAQWAADSIKALGLPLAQRVSGRQASYPLPSYAQATEGPAAQIPAGSELPFVDVAPGDWFYASVKTVCDKGLFAGTGADRFSPEVTMSRAMLVTVLWRLQGQPAPTAAASFADVEAGSWYADAVSWAKEMGVTGGYSNGNFGPNDPITREQLALMVYRYAQLQGLTHHAGADLPFADAEAIDPASQEVLSWCAASGILTGKPGNLADPLGITTRAEVAAVMTRLTALMGQ